MSASDGVVMAGLAAVGTATAGWAATGMATAGWAAADRRRAGCGSVGSAGSSERSERSRRDRRWNRGGGAARRGLWSGLGGKACTTSRTPCGTATHHIPPLPVVNPEGKEHGGIRQYRRAHTVAGYGGAPSPSSTTTHHIPPLPVPCLRPGPPPAEGKEYGGIRWYRGRVMAGPHPVGSGAVLVYSETEFIFNRSWK